MGERKVLNKYIPPDFDPSKVPKGKRPADGQIKVRMMLPMSICCQTCGNFISKGTKFNSRKEDAKGETYLGLKIFRFYFRCPRCSGEIAMKTDPERSDYIVESGASRNYEPWKGEETANELKERERKEAEEGDEMKKLENKTKASKREMDLNAALEEMKSLSARHGRMDLDGVVASVAKMGEKEREKRELEEEMRAKKMYEMAVRESKMREKEKKQQPGQEEYNKSTNDQGGEKKLEDIYSEDEEEKEARDAEEARIRRRKIIDDFDMGNNNTSDEDGKKKKKNPSAVKKKTTRLIKVASAKTTTTTASEEDGDRTKKDNAAPVAAPSALVAQYSSSSE